MFEFARDMLAIVGLGFSFGIILILISIAINEIRDVIRKRKYKHKREHRFDGPPLAKCYCKDCEHWQTDGRCNAHSGWYTADNWFCWGAEPWKYDPDEEVNNDG